MTLRLGQPHPPTIADCDAELKRLYELLETHHMPQDIHDAIIWTIADIKHTRHLLVTDQQILDTAHKNARRIARMQ